jgi:hypothetical protein
LISPGSTRALSRSLREPFNLPLAANVESANSTRAAVIGSTDMVRANEDLFICSLPFFTLFADVIAALRSPLYDIIIYYVRHYHKPEGTGGPLPFLAN